MMMFSVDMLSIILKVLLGLKVFSVILNRVMIVVNMILL